MPNDSTGGQSEPPLAGPVDVGSIAHAVSAITIET